MAASSSSSSSSSSLSTRAAVGLVSIAAVGAVGGLLWRQRKRRLAAEADAKALAAASARQSVPSDLESKFDALVAKFLEYTSTFPKIPAFAPRRIQDMLEYNCKGGKYFRGLLVLDTVKTLAAEKKLDYASLEPRAIALGWAIEVMQAYFLVADDIMDGSQLRRGKKCWYLRDEVKMDAINDSFILHSFMHFLIRSYVEDPTQQLAILNLFADVSYQTELGQMLDLHNQPQGTTKTELLDGYTTEQHAAYEGIILNKTAIYTFYLPIACGLTLCGATSTGELKTARDISTAIGVKFQIQDDYLDAFGVDIGKDGTDIQDHKCTWLLMIALLRISRLAAAEQARYLAILKANYGKKESKEAVDAVKKLYLDLGIEDEYKKQEVTSQAAILKLIDESRSILPSAIFTPILTKVHGRKK